MKRRRIDGWVYTTTVEVEQFAKFDMPTRRFIAYVLNMVPELRNKTLTKKTVAGNQPAPFLVSEEEVAGRAAAYAGLVSLRACRRKGAEGQKERRQQFAELLAMARFDIRSKRLKTYPEFHFCYERLVGPRWRELLPMCWKEAGFQKRARGSVQLPLSEYLREDSTIPRALEDD